MPTPQEIVDGYESQIRDTAWAGRAFQFTLICEDDFGASVVEELQDRGLSAVGERQWINCNCDECRGKPREADYQITVHRPAR